MRAFQDQLGTGYGTDSSTEWLASYTLRRGRVVKANPSIACRRCGKAIPETTDIQGDGKQYCKACLGEDNPVYDDQRR